MASWSLFLAGLVVGITVCVAIGYIVFLQPNPDSNVPNLPPSDTMVETPPDETSSTFFAIADEVIERGAVPRRVKTLLALSGHLETSAYLSAFDLKRS